MSERDDDIIDFDFFDEPPTVEQQPPPQRVRLPRRTKREGGDGGGGGGSRIRRPSMRPGGGSFTPLLRLIGLIAFAILIVVLLVFWVQSCQGAAKKNAYRDYLENVSEVAQTSEAVGRDFTDALTTPGAKEADLQTALTGLAQREQQNVDKARALDPPGALRDEHAAMVQALQFRTSGLQGLAETFRAAAGTKKGASADTLAAQTQRFVASDVGWDDLFKDPTKSELQRQDITGVTVPDSNFLTQSALATPGAWLPILSRLRGASTGGKTGGLHGTALEYVKALSGGQSVDEGQTLSADSENTVTATTDLAFAVGVRNSGEAQEVGIDVTLTIERTGSPIVKTQRIQVIDPGQVTAVKFTDLGQVPFAQKTTLKVDIAPVPQEARTENNSASYPVIFSLG
jgi:hypothetical protein